MTHWLGGWCPYCAMYGLNGAFIALMDFEDGWVKHCVRCRRTPEKAAEDARTLQLLREQEAEAASVEVPAYAITNSA